MAEATMLTDQTAFTRTILETPEDDAPRLVYADWLEENGNRDAHHLRKPGRYFINKYGWVHWLPWEGWSVTLGWLPMRTENCRHCRKPFGIMYQHSPDSWVCNVCGCRTELVLFPEKKVEAC